MVFFDLDAKKNQTYLQVFIQPSGWVSITDKYDPTKPREFPVANNELELFSPDDLKTTPRPRTKEGGLVVLPDLMLFRNVQVITSSTE